MSLQVPEAYEMDSNPTTAAPTPALSTVGLNEYFPQAGETKEPIPSPTLGDFPRTAFQLDSQAGYKRGRSRRKLYIGGCVAFVVILALALGLGIGLSRHSTSSNPSSANSTTTPLQPGNASDITTINSRTQLYGDQSRWLMSNRDFQISATPQTRTFNWTLSEVLSTPGAMLKPMIVVNGMSPGPVLEANLGDRLIINVFNNLTNETAVHWHGQYQRGTNFMDGTYAITQVSCFLSRHVMCKLMAVWNTTRCDLHLQLHRANGRHIVVARSSTRSIHRWSLWPNHFPRSQRNGHDGQLV